MTNHLLLFQGHRMKALPTMDLGAAVICGYTSVVPLPLVHSSITAPAPEPGPET